jgi:hypothetical protein
VRQPLGIVHILVSRQATVYRLAQQVGKGGLRILPSAGVRQMLLDQFSESETLVEFAYQDQAAVRGDARTWEIHPERGIERELKGLVLAFTHGVLASGASS